MLSTALLTLLLAPQGVVINEISYDDSGLDDREFVELYNAGTGAVDISGWLLDAEDIPLGSGSPNPDYVVTGAVGSGTTVLLPGQFYVLGNVNVPNVNQALAAGTDLWENSTESLTLRDGGGNIVDTVIYEAWNGFDPTLGEGDGITGTFANIDGFELSWSRTLDGMDTGSNRDFNLRPQSPGASNAVFGAMPYSENFDGIGVGQPSTDWRGSFENLVSVDPTVVGPPAPFGDFNPSAIPASPQGGNASVMWDSAGGGNMATLLRTPNSAVCFSAWVHIPSTLKPAGEYETWSIVVGGTCATFYNTPDPSGARGFTPNANGNRGMSWTYQLDDVGGTLYLIDHNDGGWGPNAVTPETIVATIPIQAGVNDQWQRLELAIDLNGGTYTAGFDGTTYAGTTAAAPGSPALVAVGFREFIVTHATDLRPLTMDDIVISDSLASVTTGGTATAHNFGTPTIGHTGRPTPGSTTFAVTGSGVVPSSPLSFLGVGTPATPTPIPGGIPGAQLQINIVASSSATTSGTGTVSHPLPIPMQCDLIGVSLECQLFDADLTAGVAIPFGVSGTLTALIGL